MKLDISALQRAAQRLDEGMLRYMSDTGDTQIRDGLVQRFEFTYELAHKTLKRYLQLASASPEEFDTADFPYLIRSANERGLLRSDWPQWRQYRDMRARTSHTYDEDVALAVVAGIPSFQEEAHFLIGQLEQRLA